MTNKEKFIEVFGLEPNEHFCPLSEEISCGSCPYNENGCDEEHKDRFFSMEYKEPTTKNDLGVREFEEIVVEYPPEDLCTYPEYKGKPYFSIKYEEGNDCIIGYGTYNPQVLSRYLKDYFMPTTKNDSSGLEKNSQKLEKDFGELDCISRQAVLEQAYAYGNGLEPDGYCVNVEDIQALPSVTPQEPRKGHWILRNSFLVPYKCSECNYKSERYDNYCPNCGCRMVEPQESEE